jgi:Acetyltransferase (GNAT) domain
MWDEINGVHGNHLLLDSNFVEPLVRYFGGTNTLLGLERGLGSPAMVLMNRTRRGMWQTFQPSQAPLGLILLSASTDGPRQVRRLLRALPGYALGLGVLQQDPDITVFRGMTERRGVEVVQYIETARVSVNRSFEDYWNLRGSDLVENVARRKRRLERLGIRFELLEDREPGRVSESVAEYGRLESTGWKASQGTAVTAENQQGCFYREILERFCERKEGVIYRLLFDGKTVASQLGLQRDGMLILLKMAYDESVREMSPGFLIQAEMFKAIFAERKITQIEFFGRVREGWTKKWTNETRSMFHVNVYRYPAMAWARRLLKRTSASVGRPRSQDPQRTR